MPVKISLSITARENCQNTQLNSFLTHTNFMLESVHVFFKAVQVNMIVNTITSLMCIIHVHEFPHTSENAYAYVTYASK